MPIRIETKVVCDAIKIVTKYGTWDGFRHLPAPSWLELERCTNESTGYVCVIPGRLDESPTLGPVQFSDGFRKYMTSGLVICESCRQAKEQPLMIPGHVVLVVNPTVLCGEPSPRHGQYAFTTCQLPKGHYSRCDANPWHR